MGNLFLLLKKINENSKNRQTIEMNVMMKIHQLSYKVLAYIVTKIKQLE